MRGAERVDAHRLHDRHLSADRVDADRGAERAQVVMEVDALDLGVDAVEVEPLVRVEAEGADAERGAAGVDDPAVDAQFGLQGVAVVRGREVPQPGTRHGELVGLGGPLGHGHRGGRTGDRAAVRRADPGDDLDVRARAGRVRHGGGDPDHGPLPGDLRGGDVRAPAGHVHRLRDDQTGLAVDAAAGVPAAARQPVLDPDRDHVVGDAVGVQQVGEVEGETGVAVGVAAGLDAVAVDGGVHVDAVELDRDPLAGVRGRQREGDPVPAQAAREEAGAAGRAVLRGGGLFDAPVVGDGHGAPGGVVVAGVGGVRVPAGGVGEAAWVDQREPPAVTQRDRTAPRCARGVRGGPGRRGAEDRSGGRCGRGGGKDGSARDRHGRLSLIWTSETRSAHNSSFTHRI
ncbi:hypothetical protein QF032_007132 [Streptomyces achromogenes]|nr:hypothetical protein [Streptomyces achromogenes]